MPKSLKGVWCGRVECGSSRMRAGPGWPRLLEPDTIFHAFIHVCKNLSGMTADLTPSCTWPRPALPATFPSITQILCLNCSLIRLSMRTPEIFLFQSQIPYRRWRVASPYQDTITTSYCEQLQHTKDLTKPNKPQSNVYWLRLVCLFVCFSFSA